MPKSIPGGDVDETTPVSPTSEAPLLPLMVEEPGIDQQIEKLVDALWEQGPLTVLQLAEALGWPESTLAPVLSESEEMGAVYRTSGDPHDTVDLA